MADAAPLDAESPGNPGSAGHPSGCKPCNKFNPSRPLDSCKHGQECEFCHCQHERPKHRGQRGRHALQRRQFLEARHELSGELRRLVDRVYAEPHAALDEVKRRLQGLPTMARDEKVCLVIEEIREIGEEAQRSRPDNARLRGARITTIEASSMTELDGRLKWLVGTLHLMVRKMADSKESMENIQSTVDMILNRCGKLPEAVDQPRHPVQHMGRDTSAQGHRGYERSELNDQHTWLQHKLQTLEREALGGGASPEEAGAALARLRGQGEVLARSLAAAGGELRERLRRCACLRDFEALAGAALEGYRDALLAAESLDDLRPAGAAPGAPALDARLRGLPRACGFLAGPVRELARGAARGGALGPEAEGQLDGVLEECGKLPGAIAAMLAAPQPGQLRLFETTQDVEHAISRKVLPSDSLQELLAKLRELNL